MTSYLALAAALRDGGRVIYSSPIKALSNQKYRQFCESFGAESTGLVTGYYSLLENAMDEF